MKMDFMAEFSRIISQVTLHPSSKAVLLAQSVALKNALWYGVISIHGMYNNRHSFLITLHIRIFFNNCLLPTRLLIKEDALLLATLSYRIRLISPLHNSIRNIRLSH